LGKAVSYKMAKGLILAKRLASPDLLHGVNIPEDGDKAILRNIVQLDLGCWM
jgi:hypothetical protein